MHHKYRCNFIVADSGTINDDKALEAKGLKKLRCIGNYVLYVDQNNDSQYIEMSEDHGYLMLEGMFWDDIQAKKNLLSELLNTDEQGRIRLLKEIDGFYSGIFYDHKKKSLYLFTDKFGFQNIYRTNDNKFSSNSLFMLEGRFRDEMQAACLHAMAPNQN